MLQRKRLSLWFWVALVAIITNKALLELFLNVLQQGLRLVGLH
jgi:hypothetical protein